MSWADELAAAEEIARAAGDILLDHYRDDVDVDLKAGREPVTEADRASNDFIVAQLRRRFPADAVVAEESAGPTDVRGASRVWMVDPMDGTKEFLARNGEFSVMIGLVHGGRPVVGVVHQPSSGTLYRGGEGLPAEAVDNGRADRLQVSGRRRPERFRLVLSRSHRPEAVDEMIGRLGIREVDQSGSVGLKVARIALGRNDLYLHPSGHTRLWDACAPDALLRAAGGRLTDFDGNPISYDVADILNRRGLLASNGAAHDEVVGRIAGLF